jgi:hypothetical protein
MVLAGFAPRYINIKRGAVLLGMLGLAVNPWQLTATASTFIGVISGFGIFIGRPPPQFFSLVWTLIPSTNDRNYAMRLPSYPPTTTINPRSIHWRFIFDILVSSRVPLAINLSLPYRLCTPLPGVYHEPPWQSYYLRMGKVVPNHFSRGAGNWIRVFLGDLYDLSSASL